MLNKVLKILIISGVLLTLVLIIMSLLTQQKTGKKENGNIAPTPMIINNTPSLDKQEKLQGESDAYFNQQASLFLKKYPWYNRLPEPNENFFIGFDYYKEEFYVDLYPKKSSTTPLSVQEENLKKDVLNQLKQIGVDTTKFNIDWKSLPR